MILFLDPPVHQFSTADEIRGWQRELAAMRARYRSDLEALECVTRAEEHAEYLLAQVMWMRAPAPMRAS